MSAAKKHVVGGLRSSRYQLKRCIARGGMGSVYYGMQCGAAGFARPVAIKRTHAHLLESPEMRATILREARIASAVRHPNVVSINDVEEMDDELLLIMDYVDGGSLSHIIKASKGKIPLSIVMSVALDACAGLHAIHSAKDGANGQPLGIVHRDISPQNILVGTDGAARITDFGIAKGKSDPKRTSKSQRRGKYGYMAPEYIMTGATSATTDIFALGVVIWEAIAGQRLFYSDNHLESLRLSIDCVVPSLREINANVPPALDAAIRRALAKDPKARFASVAELGFALESAAGSIIASRHDVSDFVKAFSDESLSTATTGTIDEEKSGLRTSMRPTAQYEVLSLADCEVEAVADPAFAPISTPASAKAANDASAASSTGNPISAPISAPISSGEKPVETRRAGRHRAFRLGEQ